MNRLLYNVYYLFFKNIYILTREYKTRKKDIYLQLRERTKIAKDSNADIFISIHADSNRNRRTRGISLYTLSERASDKEAEALARRENRSDLIDGIDFAGESYEVTNILIDLTKRETLNQSSHLANFFIEELKLYGFILIYIDLEIMLFLN